MVNGRKNDINIESVAQLCVEYWKLAAATEKVLSSALASDGKRLEAQLKFSKRQLDVLLQDLGLRLVDFSGERFHPGLAVSVDNPGDYEEDEVLVVGKTIEPTVMSDMTVIRIGRVIVAPVVQEEE
ncbi:hypothetical protein GE300_20270 [Rhodobacteraceae bacterium 2CG4]|uniref:Molecular chaperone GrpE n=1 Tax=Halovulum marinum TaxID=2662447 RepID=A0A6L5Z5N6_9RHOB|nr:hypothetical protein [Halovulum marinum]MSU91898.1 hypothetical protein [Halovulum marinum]